MSKVVTVIKPHISNYPTPILLTKGEKVKRGQTFLGNSNWKNWVYCYTNGQEGWVPEQILDDHGVV